MDERRRHLHAVPGGTAPTAQPPPPATHAGEAPFNAELPSQAAIQPYLQSLSGVAPQRGLAGAIEALLPAVAYAGVAGAVIGGLVGRNGRGALIGALGGLAFLCAEKALYDPGQVRTVSEKVGFGAGALAAGGAAGWLSYTG